MVLVVLFIDFLSKLFCLLIFFLTSEQYAFQYKIYWFSRRMVIVILTKSLLVKPTSTGYIYQSKSRNITQLPTDDVTFSDWSSRQCQNDRMLWDQLSQPTATVIDRRWNSIATGGLYELVFVKIFYFTVITFLGVYSLCFILLYVCNYFYFNSKSTASFCPCRMFGFL